MKTKFFLPLLMLLIGCNVSTKPLTKAQEEAVKKDVAPVVKDFFDGLIANDTAKIFALMDFGPEMTAINTGGLFNGDVMKPSALQFFSIIEKQTFKTKNEKYTVINPACFIYTWQGENEVYFKGGESVFYDNLLGSYMFRKTGGSWKILYLHESILTPEISDPVMFFTKIEDDWGDALYRKDEKALGLLYAKEYMYISPKGKIYNKEQDISEIVGPTYKVLAPFKQSDVKVSMYGTVAVVTGITTSQSMLDGKNISGSHPYMDIFTYRDGRWQCILSQSIPKP